MGNRNYKSIVTKSAVTLSTVVIRPTLKHHKPMPRRASPQLITLILDEIILLIFFRYPFSLIVNLECSLDRRNLSPINGNRLIAYLRELCCTTLGIPGRQSLRNAERGLLIIPFARATIKQNRAFTAVDPRSGMGYLWHCDCSLGFPLTLFCSSKNSFLTVLIL